MNRRLTIAAAQQSAGELDRSRDGRTRIWVGQAIEKLHADQRRSADTHLIRLDLPKLAPVTIYLKDESTHPTGSLKHRLARSLFYFGLCNGRIGPETTIVEASSGSTAISEAYFARLLGLPFIAVVPEGTSQNKIAQVEFYGGKCHAVPPAAIYEEAEALARDLGGHYMDQFTYAEQATDWRGNNNIAESLFSQMALEPDPVPEWVIVGAGTGGTAATIGRYIRYTPALNARTRLCVVDPENSVFFDYFEGRDPSIRSQTKSRIEGIGRPRVEKSFLPEVVDAMMRVPDAASCAGALWLRNKIGRLCGASTGTNIYAAVRYAARIAAQGRRASIVTLICDGGERYAETCFDAGWRCERGLDVSAYGQELERLGG